MDFLNGWHRTVLGILRGLRTFQSLFPVFQSARGVVQNTFWCVGWGFFFICNWPETVTFSKHEKCKLKKIVVTLFTPFGRTTVILVFWLWMRAYSSCHSYFIVCGQFFLTKLNWNTKFSQQRSLVKCVLFYCVITYSAMLFSSELLLFHELTGLRKPLGFPIWGFQVQLSAKNYEELQVKH